MQENAKIGLNGIESDRMLPPLIGALGYWRALFSEGNPPSRADIDPMDIKDILPNINLVDVVRKDGSYRFRHRLVGTLIAKMFKGAHTGEWFDELYTREHLDTHMPEYIHSIETMAPVFREQSMEGPGYASVRYQRLVLPLREEDGAVHILMVVFGFDPDDVRNTPNEIGLLPIHKGYIPPEN